jgi:Trk-type K+ transport system membrane component
MGGLGWRVIDDIWSNRKNLSYKKLSLHSRLVIRTSFSLIIFGSLGFFVTETLLNSQFFSDLNFFEKILSSIFETVSARTAGFTNFPISLNSISDTGLLLLMTLMFIGASTGGTGGGIKTTTFIALMAATRSTLRGQKDVIISNRLISDKVILKAVGITVGSLLFVLLMAMLLSTTNTFIKKESFTFLEILFTCISAFATVGFDIGLTAKLNHFGQFILIIGMFVGRLGILLLLSALWQALYKSRIERQKRIGYPKADLYV